MLKFIWQAVLNYFHKVSKVLVIECKVEDEKGELIGHQYFTRDGGFYVPIDTKTVPPKDS